MRLSFEAKGKLEGMEEQVEEGEAPQFLTEFQDAFKEEGDSVYIEAQLFPKGDGTMKIEWLKDGESLPDSKFLFFSLKSSKTKQINGSNSPCVYLANKFCVPF